MPITLNLRQAIIQRMQDKTPEELRDVIDDSIGAEERVLPGLGVLFELIWQHTGDETKQELVQTLQQHLPH
ncbi:small acid-soluble spore protein SspI [Paenibacillus chartarius]|uniref:Small, acid-soluble spore protein I n=1 Tax=Paenibacillus chartarius TaxID=747481 RepID=A0ABV6DRJ9_9BACL